MRGAVDSWKRHLPTTSCHAYLYHAVSALCASLQWVQAHARDASLCCRRSSQHTRSTRWVSSPSPSRPPCSTWPLEVINLRGDAHPASRMRRVRTSCSQNTQQSGACSSGKGMKKRAGRGRLMCAGSDVPLLRVSYDCCTYRGCALPVCSRSQRLLC